MLETCDTPSKPVSPGPWWHRLPGREKRLIWSRMNALGKRALAAEKRSGVVEQESSVGAADAESSSAS